MEIINPADGAVELLAVVQTGAFTRAADQLGVSPAHVSRQVKALEARLGVKLLQRTTRVVRLTEAGVNYVSAVAPLIEGLHAANQRAQEASQTLRGRIRVTAGGRYAEDIVAPILADFCLVHPEVELSLDLSTRMVDLIAEGYDLGIRYGRLLDSNLIAQRLSVFPLIAVATPDYLARCGTPERPEALRHHACIKHGPEPWIFREGEADLVVEAHGPFNTNSGGGAVAAILAGLGVGYLPEVLVKKYIDRGDLLPILEPFKDVTRSSWLVYPDRAFVPARVRGLMAHLRSAFAG